MSSSNAVSIKHIIDGKRVDECFDVEYDLPRISLCTPLYNSSIDWFLTEYLYSIRQLDYPKHLLSLYFTVQGYDDTYNIMNRWLDIVGDEYAGVKIERVDMIQSDEIPHIQNVVKCRNLLKKWSKDDVFFIDCDNFPPPHSLKRLVRGSYMGGDVVGSPYLFHKLNQSKPKQVGFLGLTAFFIHSNGSMYYPIFNVVNGVGRIHSSLLTGRVWCDAISMGCTVVRRSVLDNIDFYVPFKTGMTDDTAFCQKASEAGYRIMADFTFTPPHWGFRLDRLSDDGEYACFSIGLTNGFSTRRERMKKDGVVIKYVKHY